MMNFLCDLAGIKSSASTTVLGGSMTPATTPASMHPSASFPTFQANESWASSDGLAPQQVNGLNVSSSSLQPMTAEWTNNSSFMQGASGPPPTIVRNPTAPMLYNPEARNPVKVPEVAYHWFYKICVSQGFNPLLMGYALNNTFLLLFLWCFSRNERLK